MKVTGVLGAVFASLVLADFDWSSIAPSTDLEFHSCFGPFECARLVLPLDWIERDSRNVTIAITRLPAVVSRDDPSHAGTIFTQPGGPGSSGTLYLQVRHERLRDIVDIPGKRHYDLLSFDPRGVNRSEPRIQCFDGLAGHMRLKEMQSLGMIDLSNSSLAIKLAAAKVDGEQCAKVHGDFLAYLGTADVARDMLAIMDKLGEIDNAEDARLELRSLEKPLPRLNYIGISYGTLLGNYFASMFPGRVGRMVLDGVCNAPEYAHEQGWVADMDDTDLIARRFFDGCFSASSRCALYRESDSSGDSIYSRYTAWRDSLDSSPIFVASPRGHRLILRSSDITLHFIQQVYNAEYKSQFLAAFLSDAMTDPSILGEKYSELLAVKLAEDACASDTNDPLAPLEIQSAIACSDADDLTGRALSYWRNYVDELRSRSPLAGWFSASLRLACSAWPTRAKRAFKGPFKTPKASLTLKEDVPAAPILFLSNRWDPVTPLANARLMSKDHPDSGLLVQEATGHCVILGPYGDCVRATVSRYFDTGEVPKGEATCKSTKGAWDEEN